MRKDRAMLPMQAGPIQLVIIVPRIVGKVRLRSQAGSILIYVLVICFFQRLQSLFETLHWWVDNACADLADAWKTMSNACFDYWRHIQAANLADIDAGGCASEVERGYAK